MNTMDYKGHKLYLQNKDGKFEEFTYEMAIETMMGQTQVADELQNRINKAIEYIEKFIPIDSDTILMRERQREYLLEI